MKVVDSFPRAVRQIENRWIPLSDGCRLAARIWLPEDAESRPVPAILEYLPYRKRDFTRGRDQPTHHYFAGHGYAAVRVDLRGTGDSEGLLQDEYLPRELEDATEVIRWIASEPWCTGAVGMMGISWGGFNSLQVAALRPPQLAAVLTLCGSDDRYADDAHYMGGCLLNENLIWGSVLLAFNAYPPDPELVGERWRTMWLERLENAVLFPEQWLRHQRRDAYWKHGSVCEDYSRIACPVYAVGGWADAYSNTIPRLLAGLTVPRKGLIGPWSHAFPHAAVPGPPIGFLQEALRWWDHWLKGIDTGIMREPMVRVWMQDSVPPQASPTERPGRWVAEACWPSPRIAARRWVLNASRLEADRRAETKLCLRSPQTTGVTAGDWCSFGAAGELPGDQRADDARSLTFDSEPLEQRIEILGAPAVEIELSVDRPRALLAVRLCEVFPDGASARVSYALLNLTHRASHELPEALEPGARCRVRIQLNDVAHAFPAGHRIRVAVSTSYWPVAWPAAEPAELTLFAGASMLELPVRPPASEDAHLVPFQLPEQAPPLAHTALRPAKFARTLERDPTSGETTYTILSDGGEFDGASLARVDEIDLELGYSIRKLFRIGESDPLSARAEIEQRTLLKRRDGSTRIRTWTRLSSTQDAFRIEGQLEADEDEARVFSRTWTRTVARDLL